MQLIVAVLLGVSLLVPTASFAAEKVVVMAVSYTHLTLPTNREV